MAGTSEGGKKVAAKIKAKDPDFYKRIGMLGQMAWARSGRRPRGFATMDPEKLRHVSAKGGRKSRPPKHNV